MFRWEDLKKKLIGLPCLPLAVPSLTPRRGRHRGPIARGACRSLCWGTATVSTARLRITRLVGCAATGFIPLVKAGKGIAKVGRGTWGGRTSPPVRGSETGLLIFTRGSNPRRENSHPSSDSNLRTLA